MYISFRKPQAERFGYFVTYYVDIGPVAVVAVDELSDPVDTDALVVGVEGAPMVPSNALAHTTTPVEPAEVGITVDDPVSS
jgi:hypothetical protein